jgi:hypothetical protein
MSKEKPEDFESKIELPKAPEGATDMELLEFLTGHIDSPCTVEVDGVTHNVRHVYLKMAKEAIPKMTNPYARQLLIDKIKEHEPDYKPE